MFAPQVVRLRGRSWNPCWRLFKTGNECAPLKNVLPLSDAITDIEWAQPMVWKLGASPIAKFLEAMVDAVSFTTFVVHNRGIAGTKMTLSALGPWKSEVT